MSDYTPTHLRLTLTSIISLICGTSSTGFARWIDIYKTVNQETGQRQVAVAVMLRGLVLAGWIERPFRGSYVLTTLGRKVLDEWIK